MKGTHTVAEAIAALQAGQFVALLDHPEREERRTCSWPRQFATGEKLNVMIVRARVPGDHRDERLASRGAWHSALGAGDTGSNWPRFSAPVDYTVGTTTGVSAFDRAATARALVDPAADPAHFMRPGHLFPLAASPGGIAERPGHTEGAVALALAAGLYPAVVMCEMLAEDGRMARGEDLVRLIREEGFVSVTVQQLADYEAGPAPA